MLYEIYIFFWVTISLLVLSFYKVFLVLLYPFTWFISYLKKEYYKFFSLNSIKKQVLEETNKSWELVEALDKDIIKSEKEEKKQKNNELRLKSRVEKLFLKAEVAKQKWDIEELERLLVEMLSIDENNVRALETLSNLYITLWKDKKAFSLLKKLIQLDMENDNAIWNLAKLYLDLWEVDTADILIQKAISINSHNHRYYVTYADILYNKWDLENAIRAIERVLEIKPKNVIYLDALASLYEEMWDFAKARSYWLEIVDLEPDYEKAKEKLQWV